MQLRLRGAGLRRRQRVRPTPDRCDRHCATPNSFEGVHQPRGANSGRRDAAGQRPAQAPDHTACPSQSTARIPTPASDRGAGTWADSCTHRALGRSWWPLWMAARFGGRDQSALFSTASSGRLNAPTQRGPRVGRVGDNIEVHISGRRGGQVIVTRRSRPGPSACAGPCDGDTAASRYRTSNRGVEQPGDSAARVRTHGRERSSSRRKSDATIRLILRLA